MTIKEMIDQLVTEANTNKASDAAFHVMAFKRSARNGVFQLSAFTRKMKKEGFNYSNTDYVPLLKLLAQLGMGQLNKSTSGKVIGLKNMTYTMSSIGMAAAGKAPTLEPYKARNKYTPLVPPLGTKADRRKKSTELLPETLKQTDINLELIIHGKAVKLILPKGMTPMEIATLISKVS